MTELRRPDGEIIVGGKCTGRKLHAVNVIYTDLDGYDLLDEKYKGVGHVDRRQWDPKIRFTTQGYLKLAEEIERITGRDDHLVIVS